jgi:hypothetical protein
VDGAVVSAPSLKELIGDLQRAEMRYQAAKGTPDVAEALREVQAAQYAAHSAVDAMTAERDALRACLTELRDAAAACLTEVTP